MIGILGLVLAILVLIVGSYKGMGALAVTLLAALVAIITNGVNIWTGYSTSYMAGYAGAYTSYFILFAFSALYAKLMEETGCAVAIGYSLIDWFGKKYVLLVSTILISVLTYGGVSLFVVIFATGPIMFMLLKEANLPRHLAAAVFTLGSSTYTMTSLPGTPSLTNIIPTQYLGTKMTAAPVLSIVISIALFILGYFYCMRMESKARRLNETWSFPEGTDTAKYNVTDRNILPSAWKAFLPIVILIGIILIGSRFIENSTMLSVLAMVISTIICYFLNLDKVKNKSVNSLLTNGLNGGISAIGGLAAVVGFGTVAQNTIAYKTIVEWLLSLNMHPYVEGVFSTAIISGITGSSSGGLRLTFESLTKYFVESGCNLDTLHRLMAVAAGSLDTLPHAAGIFLVLSYMGLTHKMAYKHIFWISVVIPAIVVSIATAICVYTGI